MASEYDSAEQTTKLNVENAEDFSNDVTVDKCLFSAFYCLLNLATGIYTVMLGSILLDLQLISQTDSAQISWIYTTKSVGMLTGVVTVSLVTNTHRRYMAFVTCWAFTATLLVMPFCKILELLAALTFVQGFSCSIISVGGVVDMAAIWGQRKSASLLIMVFWQYVGFFIAPALAYPFKSIRSWPQHQEPLANCSVQNQTLCPTVHPGARQPGRELREVQLNLLSLSGIVASIIATSATLVSIQAYRMRGHFTGGNHEKPIEGNVRPHSLGTTCFFFAVAAVVQFAGEGQITCTIGSYLESYVVNFAKMSKYQATVIVTCFAVAYVTWAVIGIYLKRKFGSSVLFFMMVLSNICGTTVLLNAGRSYAMLCLGCALLGVGLSGKSAQLICWVTEITGNTKHFISVVYAASALGDITFANLVGRFIDEYPKSFVHILFTGSVCMLISFVVGHVGYVVLFGSGKRPWEAIRSLIIRQKQYESLP